MPTEWNVPQSVVKEKLFQLFDKQWTAEVWDNFMECLNQRGPNQRRWRQGGRALFQQPDCRIGPAKFLPALVGHQPLLGTEHVISRQMLVADGADIPEVECGLENYHYSYGNDWPQ